MPTTVHADIRPARAADAGSIAQIHAASWRRHYRGAYSDHYLDGDVDADRLKVWSGRLCQPGDDRFTLVAEHQGEMVGFGHMELDADPVWGSLLDNLHVLHVIQRSGVGTRLLDALGRTIIELRPDSGFYLWVLEQNKAAQAFYLSRGGIPGDRELVVPPQGDPRNLCGRPYKNRITWADPSVTLQSE